MALQRSIGLSVKDRIQKSCAVDANGCWLWQGKRNLGGYGQMSIGYKTGLTVHRVSYQAFVGPIPEGLHLDHLCRVRHCCNPEHLEPVTPRENALRGETIVAAHIAATHCPSGHPYSGSNLYITPTGYRYCRTCNRQAVRRYTQKRQSKSQLEHR